MESQIVLLSYIGSVVFSGGVFYATTYVTIRHLKEKIKEAEKRNDVLMSKIEDKIKETDHKASRVEAIETKIDMVLKRLDG